MRVKFSNIILVFALTAFAMPNLTYGQEGEIEGDKTESPEIIQKDSIPIGGELNPAETLEQSDVLPVGPMPQFDFTRIPSTEVIQDKDDKKPAIGNGEKSKAEESQSNVSFNFIYYLFYKFKLVEATDG